MKYFTSLLKNWKNFSGTTNRREFWFGYLGAAISLVLFYLISIPYMVLAINIAANLADNSPVFTIMISIFYILFVLYAIFIAIALIAAQARRFRDAGQNPKIAWFNLIGATPVLLVLCAIWNSELDDYDEYEEYENE